MISRRRLLLGGLVVAGAFGLGVGGFGRMVTEGEVVSILRRRLAFLKLDEAGLHAFAHDQIDAWMSKRIPTWNRLRYHFQSAVAPSFQRFYRSTDTRSRTERTEDSLISTYLLSSNFFLTGAQESRVVEYVAYYDPLHPCGNPFARPVAGGTTST